MKKVKSNTGGNTLRKKMKQRSRKIKSKRLTNYVRKKILKAFPHLKQKDVMLPKDGQIGPDFILSKNAKKLLLHQFERTLTLYSCNVYYQEHMLRWYVHPQSI